MPLPEEPKETFESPMYSTLAPALVVQKLKPVLSATWTSHDALESLRVASARVPKGPVTRIATTKMSTNAVDHRMAHVLPDFMFGSLHFVICRLASPGPR